MYNYMTFWTLVLLCFVFCLLFHGVGVAFSAMENRRREKKVSAQIERDKREAMEMINKLKAVISTRPSGNKKESVPAPEGGGAVS